MTSYYNEWDKACCETLQRQIDNGSLSAGYVDNRSIADVQPTDLEGYNEAHFFAGIGGFALGFARTAIPANVTLWTGGFPCQDLSVAGKRAGLAGNRSGFYFEFHRLITSRYPEWVVLENVPGLLSSNAGRDFAIVIGGLTGIIPSVPNEGWGNAGLFRGPVYSVAYRVLDAQFYGVPQRRRRVFIVASLGSGRAAQVLFEREGLRGDTPPRRETGKDAAYSLRSNPSHSGDKGDGRLNTTLLALPLARGGRQDLDNETYVINLANSGANSGANQNNVKTSHVSDTIDTWATQAIAWNGIQITSKTNRSLPTVEFAPTLDQGGQMMTGVRRLTPTECERLQGFPDGWTAGQSDTQRYRQLGNAIAVPCAEWIGRRIMESA